MKTEWKIIACAALVLPLLAVSADARGTKKKQNNYYKTSITGYLYNQKGDDYKKEKIKTDDVIQAMLAQIGKEDAWKAKNCDIIMQFGDNEDSMASISWWLYHKDKTVPQKVRIDGMIGLTKSATYSSVVRRKFTAKGDNEKANWQFTFADFMVNASGYKMNGSLSGSTDVTIKGLKGGNEAKNGVATGYLNNLKLRTSGAMVTGDDDPGSVDVKVKGRISNASMEEAQDVTPVH
jgi:hypothetical protein